MQQSVSVAAGRRLTTRMAPILRGDALARRTTIVDNTQHMGNLAPERNAEEVWWSHNR